MQYAMNVRRISIAMAAMTALSVPVLAAQAAPIRVSRGPQPRGCAALGTYQIGPRALPMRPHPRAHSGTQPRRSAPAGRPVVIAWPVSALRGTLTISAYSACGQPTAGTFSVQRLLVRPPIQPYHRAIKAIPCAEVCGWPPAGVITATGSFSQDALHPHDATFVTVSATITSTRPGPPMGRPCSATYGCPPPSVIISSVSFSAVTGYLQVVPGGQSAILTFLPPPSANNAAAPQPLTLQGWRGGLPMPNPVPAPGAPSP